MSTFFIVVFVIGVVFSVIFVLDVIFVLNEFAFLTILTFLTIKIANIFFLLTSAASADVFCFCCFCYVCLFRTKRSMLAFLIKNMCKF